MNILLTCVGRRNYLVDYFKEALHPYGGKVHAFNSDSNSAALWQADYPVISPHVTAADYPVFLEKYCITHHIRAVISLLDIELPVLASLKERFTQSGITVIVADPWVVEMAHDKWLTYQFLLQHNLHTIPNYIDLNQALEAIHTRALKYPLFVKPRWGMGSIALHKAENEEDLIFYYKKTKQLISFSALQYVMAQDVEKSVLIQAMCPGQEYGLDIINDLNGQPMVTVVKQKLAMRSGETDHAITVHHPELEQLGSKIAGITQHPGNLDMDVFWDGEKAYILELNPRFGGGYPFSHVAGINLPKAIIAWLQNEPVNKKEWLTAKYGIEGMKGITIIVKSEK
jgi:carbamoyl-phosphate synthase large subunit